MDKLDVLNRGEFVEKLVNLVKNISDNNTSTCFAINGAWGCGKSFVLDMFEEQLSLIQSEETYNEKYFIVRYNCWKYDYYEEPLIAIVSSILAEIDRKIKLIPNSKQKSQAIGMLKSISDDLFSVGNAMVIAETGIDLKRGFKILFRGIRKGSEEYNKKHEYDKYFQLNKVKDTLSDSLKKIAKEYTVVIIVDELDRCIPKYAIKVLERLHHLTEEKSNIITIIATDKKQLEYSVRHLFGFEEGNKYLEKFINFEIKLDKGEVSENITEKYKDFFELFDKNIVCFKESVEQCVKTIFGNIDARKQEEILRKTSVAHKLLFSDKKDNSFMCVELIIAVMIYQYDYHMFDNGNAIHISSFDSLFVPYVNSNRPYFLDSFVERFEKIRFLKRYPVYSNDSTVYILPEEIDLYAAILFTWYDLHNSHNGSVHFSYTKDGVYEFCRKNVAELKKFIEVLQMIK